MSSSFTRSKLNIQTGSDTVGPVIQVRRNTGMIMCKALTVSESGGSTHCIHIFKLAMVI